MRTWDRGAGEKFRHIGIMHETYEVPQGHWENISHNFRPFGICNYLFIDFRAQFGGVC